MTSPRRRVLLLLLLGVGAALVSLGTLELLDQRSLMHAGDTLTAQLAGDLQAAFDPATLRPGNNPTGAEYLVLHDGDLVTSSDLPLGIRPTDLLEDGQPVEAEGYAMTTRQAADDDGVTYLLVAYVPDGSRTRVVLAVAILLPVLVVIATAGRHDGRIQAHP